MGNRLKNRDVKARLCFSKWATKMTWTKIIFKNGKLSWLTFFLYYHRWTQFVNHTGVMAAILQIENKIKLSYNTCNSFRSYSQNLADLVSGEEVIRVLSPFQYLPVEKTCPFVNGIRESFFMSSFTLWSSEEYLKVHTVFLLNCTTLLFIGEKWFAFQWSARNLNPLD